MKARIALIIYFISCLFAIVSNTIGFRDGMLWSKVTIVPAVALYYLIKSKYKINVSLIGVLFCCYVGDIYILISPNDHTSVEILCFFFAYLLLVIYLLPNFLKIKWRYNQHLVLMILSCVALAVLAYLILTLQFEKIQIGIIMLVLYAITLSFLMLISIVEYFRKSNKASFNLLIACMFFYFSDSFYIIDKFYLAFFILDFVQLITQVLSYYFLVNFFMLSKNKALI